jgi:hypothetical protein
MQPVVDSLKEEGLSDNDINRIMATAAVVSKRAMDLIQVEADKVPDELKTYMFYGCLFALNYTAVMFLETGAKVLEKTLNDTNRSN